jgi:hypothetical protein
MSNVILTHGSASRMGGTDGLSSAVRRELIDTIMRFRARSFNRGPESCVPNNADPELQDNLPVPKT